MTKQKAAELLGVSTRQIEKYAKEGRLTTTYVRGQYGNRTADYNPEELERIKGQQEKAFQARPAAPQIISNGTEPESGPGGELVTAGQARPEQLAQFLAAMEQLPAVVEAIQKRPALALGEKLLLTLEEAQALTGLSRHVLRDAIRDGQLQAKQIGRAWRVKRNDLETYIQNL